MTRPLHHFCHLKINYFCFRCSEMYSKVCLYLLKMKLSNYSNYSQAQINSAWNVSNCSLALACKDSPTNVAACLNVPTTNSTTTTTTASTTTTKTSTTTASTSTNDSQRPPPDANAANDGNFLIKYLNLASEDRASIGHKFDFDDIVIVA